MFYLHKILQQDTFLSKCHKEWEELKGPTAICLFNRRVMFWHSGWNHLLVVIDCHLVHFLCYYNDPCHEECLTARMVWRRVLEKWFQAKYLFLLVLAVAAMSGVRTYRLTFLGRCKLRSTVWSKDKTMCAVSINFEFDEHTKCGLTGIWASLFFNEHRQEVPYTSIFIWWFQLSFWIVISSLFYQIKCNVKKYI